MRWHVPDALAEKYYSISPYSYAGNNPVNFIDINGDSLWITHRAGFLGLGGEETLFYENGNLFNKDKSAYTGEVKGFLYKTVSALDQIRNGCNGTDLVNQVQSSKNNITISRGSNSYSFELKMVS